MNNSDTLNTFHGFQQSEHVRVAIGNALQKLSLKSKHNPNTFHLSNNRVNSHRFVLMNFLITSPQNTEHSKIEQVGLSHARVDRILSIAREWAIACFGWRSEVDWRWGARAAASARTCPPDPRGYCQQVKSSIDIDKARPQDACNKILMEGPIGTREASRYAAY